MVGACATDARAPSIVVAAIAPKPCSTARRLVERVMTGAPCFPEITWWRGVGSTAKENSADIGIGCQVPGRPVPAVAAEHQDIAAIGERERVERVLLDHQHRDAALVDRADG